MTQNAGAPVVVSLTPLPLKADSRTLKQVTSVYRFGLRSVAIEGSASGFLPGSVPFEVIAVRDSVRPSGGSSKADAAGGQTASPDPSAQASECIDGAYVSGLAKSAWVKTVVRSVPGLGRVSQRFQLCMDQAIQARRAGRDAVGPVSTREIAASIPRATLAFAGHCAIIPLKMLVPANLRSFVRHLTTYIGHYFWHVIRVTPRADIYYLHAFYQFPAVFTLCIVYRAKMIYDAHDFYSQMEDEGSLSSYWKTWVMPWERLVERACVWFASDVVTVNDGIATLMRERFGCEPVILRNVHDLRLDVAPERGIREVLGLTQQDFLIVSIGNWKMGMAMEQMLDALAKLPPHVHLAFLGKGYPPLDAMLAARGIAGRVHVVPPVLPQEVVPFIRAADASVVLYYGKSINYQNALPNRFFQSIAAELPLVYPDLAEIRRLADRYGVGLMVDPQVPAEIAAAFRQLIDDEPRRNVIRQNLHRAARELCWEGEEKVLADLLARHLSPKASAAVQAR
jgi:glycosyltransferase involved in cell wall biosynthesis